MRITTLTNLKNSNIEELISQNISISKIMNSLKFSNPTTKLPSKSTVQTYISKKLNLSWDKAHTKWYSPPPIFPEFSFSANNSLVTKHSDIIDLSNELSITTAISSSTLIEQINLFSNNDPHESTDSNSNEVKESSDDSINILKSNEDLSIDDSYISKENSDLPTSVPRIPICDVDFSLYPKYITLSDSKKISISINSFILNSVIETVNKDISYIGFDSNNSLSTIIQVALLDYLRLTKK